MSMPSRSGHGGTGPARPSGIGTAIRLTVSGGFVATLAYASRLLTGVTAGVSVPFAPLLAAIGLLSFLIIVYAFAPGPV